MAARPVAKKKKHPPGFEKRGNGNIWLHKSQWNTIHDEMLNLGTVRKPSKTETFFAPNNIVAAANHHVDGLDKYETAFPYKLSKYRTMFENLDPLTHPEINFKVNQCTVRNDNYFGPSLRRNALNAYEDYCTHHMNGPRVAYEGEETKIPAKYPSRTQFITKWQACQSYCHYFICYNPYYSTKREAYDAAFALHEILANPEKDEHGNTKKKPDGTYLRPTMKPQEMTRQLRSNGILLWYEKKMEDLSETHVNPNAVGPNNKSIFYTGAREEYALKVIKSLMITYGAQTFLTKFMIDGSKDVIVPMQKWLHHPETPEEYYKDFSWITDVELSAGLQAEENVLFDAWEETQIAKVRQEVRLKHAKMKVDRFRKKMREGREKVMKVRQWYRARRIQRTVRPFLQRIRVVKEPAAVKIQGLVRAYLYSVRRAEPGLSEKERSWLRYWMPETKRPSLHLVARSKQLKEAADWLQEKLAEDSWKAETDNFPGGRAIRKNTGLSRQPDSRVNAMLRRHVKTQANALYTEQSKTWADAWATIYQAEREEEKAIMNEAAFQKPYMTCWDEGHPGKRSFYVTKLKNSEEFAGKMDGLPIDPARAPPKKWQERAHRMFFTIRSLVDDTWFQKVYTPPSAMKANKLSTSDVVVTPAAFMVGVKFGLFHPEWDEEGYEKCCVSLKLWLFPPLRSMFHVYMMSFFEIASQADPKVKKHIWQFVHEKDKKGNWTFKKDKSFRYPKLFSVSRELFDEYADLVHTKKFLLKRQPVKDMSDETKNKTLDVLEEESKAWVAKMPKTFFNYRHEQLLKPANDWEFKPEEWLKDKPPFGQGYFDPDGPKGLNEQERARTEATLFSRRPKRSWEEENSEYRSEAKRRRLTATIMDASASTAN